MERKIDDIIQAFREHQFENSLKLIVDMEKKREKKGKKQGLSEYQEVLVEALKASSLAKLARYGEAAEAMNAFKLPEKVDVDYTAILIHVARDLQMEEREKEVLSRVESQKDLISTKQKKGYFVVQYVFINKRRFSDANKFYFNLYNTTKQPVNFFNSIYLQFLDVLAKNNALIQKKDGLILARQGMDLRMVKMFFDKLMNVQSLEGFLKEKVGEEVLKFSVRLLITMKEVEKGVEMLEKYEESLSDFWVSLNFFKSIYKLDENRLDNLLAAYLRLFKNNTDLVKYKPALEAYLQYADLLLKNAPSVNIIEAKQQQLFTLNAQPSLRLDDFLSCLIHDFNQKMDALDKSADYYKYSLKNSLYCILYIFSKTHSLKQHSSYLTKYVELFSNTLTFAEELYDLTKEPTILTKPEHYKADSSIIFDINYHKLQYLWKVIPIPKTQEELQQTALKFTGLYSDALSLQSVEVLEKGERHLADEFLSVLSDIFREYLTFNADIESLINIISILEWGLRKSPFNFDLKTKLIIWYQKLGNPYRLMRIYETMDIKSSQFEVLGYFLYPQIHSFRLYNEFEEVLLKALRSYQENEKEIEEYSYNCLEEERHSIIEQFLSYQEYLQRSYSKINLLYLLSRLPKSRNGVNEKFIGKLALKKLRERLTWNCDAKVIRSTINPERQKPCFFDVLNSHKVLRNQLKVRQQQLNLTEENQVINEIEELEKVDLQQLLNPSYQTLQNNYSYSIVGSVEEKEIEKSLNNYNTLIELGRRVNIYIRSIVSKQSSETQSIHQSLDRILAGTWELSAKSMIITQQKISDIILLINYYAQPMTKRRKKLKQEEMKALEELVQIREKCYEVVCGYKEKELGFKLWIENEEFVKDYRNIEKQLNNLAKMNKREFDKFYKIQ